MGVRRLWQLVKPAGRTRALTELSCTEGFELNASGYRGFRVGIDASIWLFHTQWSREGQSPELRMLFYRCCKQLLGRNILPVFVFDGSLRPQEKRGKCVISRDLHWLVAPFIEMLEAFGYEWRMAPGEAEAELALMSRRGWIDAVWTDDADALVFGATKVMRNLSPRLQGNLDNPKLQDGNHTVIYAADEIRCHSQVYLTHGGLILVALLSGGDYLPAGLPSCGPETSHGLALCGYGDELLSAARDLDDDGLNAFLKLWRNNLREELRTNSSKCLPSKSPAIAATLTDNFPSVSLVRLYTNPVTSESTPEPHLEAPSWSREVDVGLLGRFCETHFEWGTKDGIVQRFRNVLYDGLIIRFLRRSTIDNDMHCPRHPLSLLCETTITKVVKDRKISATDNLLEYAVRVSPNRLDDLATKKLLGSRQPLNTSFPLRQATPIRVRRYMSTHARSQSKNTKRLAASLQVWVPAEMLRLVCPNLVHDSEMKKVREEKKHAKKLERISHGQTSTVNTGPSAGFPSRLVTPAARHLEQTKILFPTTKKAPASRKTKSKGSSTERTISQKNHSPIVPDRTFQTKIAADYASSGEDSEVEFPRNPFKMLRSTSRQESHIHYDNPFVDVNPALKTAHEDKRSVGSHRAHLASSSNSQHGSLPVTLPRTKSSSNAQSEQAVAGVKFDSDIIYVSDSDTIYISDSDTVVSPNNRQANRDADIVYVSSDSDN